MADIDRKGLEITLKQHIWQKSGGDKLWEGATEDVSFFSWYSWSQRTTFLWSN